MREETLLGLSSEGFHRMYYREYGTRTHPTLVAAHGLTRNSSDFHFLGEALKSEYRIIAPDIVGRGKSDRFKNPLNYNFPQYLSDITSLIARTGVKKLFWFGTSMGGLLGLILASLICPFRLVEGLILNDVGPVVPKVALDRLRMYAGIKLVFRTMLEASAALRTIYKPFGLHKESHWQYLIEHSLAQQEDGTYTLDYDPGAVIALTENQPEIKGLNLMDQEGNLTFWQYWDTIRCPVLVIQGKQSDILTDDVIAEMRTRGPKFDHLVIENVGHAPAFYERDQIKLVQQWLEKRR